MSTTVTMRNYGVDWTPDSVGFYADIRGAIDPNAGVLDNLRVVPVSPILEVNGDLTLGSNATLEFSLGENAFDQIFVTGAATLDGTIAIDLTGAFTIPHGREYTVLTAEGGITDLGVTYDLPENFTASIVDMTQLVLTYSAISLAGDFNNDGIVDAADYTVWRNNVGAPAGTLPNDPDGGVIGSAQYLTWKGNFGATSNLANLDMAASVPEPSTWMVIGWGLVSLAVCRRKLVKN